MSPQSVVTQGAGVPEVEQEPLQEDWFFTFGWDHAHPVTGAPLRNSFVRIHGTRLGTREEMNAAFGNRWAFQYSLAEKAFNIDRFNLVEVPMPGQQPGVDDDEALREVYAQDELDQDRVPTEAGFDVWKSLRCAVGQGEPPVTPAEARTGISDVQAAVLDEVSRLRSIVAAKHGDHLTYIGADEIIERLDRIAQLAGGGRQ